MKKRKRHTPTLFDRFCKTFGPAIMRICQFIDKQTHDFFEVLACILTGGAYQPKPYKEPKESKDYTRYSSYNPRESASDSMAKDFRAIMGDFRSVCHDTSKAVQQMAQEDPEVVKAIQEAKNSPTYQEQERKVREKMAEIQRQCDHIRQVCSHNTTVGSGNTSNQNTRA